MVRSVAELKKAGTRLGQHHQLSFRVPYLVTNQLIIQPEVTYQRNRGNVPFYHFSISEGRLVTFYRFQEKRLVQLMTAWRKLRFPHRQTGNDNRFRQDLQLRLEGKFRWKLTNRLTLTADYHRYQNRTNETVLRLSFLNFEQNRCWVTIEYAN